jgi:hypothetical protein
VLAVVTETGSGKTSGVPVRHSIATLYTVIDGKIVRITTFPSEQEALEAIGAAGVGDLVPWKPHPQNGGEAISRLAPLHLTAVERGNRSREVGRFGCPR